MKKRRIFTTIAVLQLVLTMFYAGAQDNGRKVDFSADVMLPVKTSDSSAYSLVGNVIFYHNGAVITCDSAVRYGERRMECYNNVIITQDSTFIYGDRATYNGLTNTVDVQSPLVKVLDGDATLYTRKFSFNTLDNIGRFSEGGIMRQGDTRLEAEDGYYYSDTHDMIASQSVQMQDSIYKLSTDSVRYNTDEKRAYFFNNTRIWSDEGEFLMADQGSYQTETKIYDFTKNSYILTEEQEIRADSIWYDAINELAIMQRDIQIFDKENLSFAFGDYATYDKDDGDRILLTQNPSIASYEQDQDTLYLRADTMLMVTALYKESDLEPEVDSLAVGEFFADSLVRENFMGGMDRLRPDDADMREHASRDREVRDREHNHDDHDHNHDHNVAEAPEVEEPAIEPEPTEKQLKAQAKAQAREQKQAAREAKREARDQKIAQKILDRQNKLLAKMGQDSLVVENTAVIIEADTASQIVPPEDIVTIIEQDTVAVDTASMEQRFFHAFGNVKAYRHDVQMVCDSMVGYSIDSTIHMFGNPIMWNQENQITSEKAVLYSKDQQLDHALFTGAPIMAAEVDSAHYNQIKGREITALFRDNEMYQVDVDGNSQTYYYMTEDSTRLITGFLVAESANITFIIEDRAMETITFYTEPAYTIYPMNKIPDTQSLLLPGFVWQQDRRPEFKDVFTRTILEPLRPVVEQYDKPAFPIMIDIDELRTKLVEEGLWRDREDDLSPDVQEYVRKLEMQLEPVNAN